MLHLYYYHISWSAVLSTPIVCQLGLGNGLGDVAGCLQALAMIVRECLLSGLGASCVCVCVCVCVCAEGCLQILSMMLRVTNPVVHAGLTCPVLPGTVSASQLCSRKEHCLHTLANGSQEKVCCPAWRCACASAVRLSYCSARTGHDYESMVGCPAQC
jgi:hypothetical protein